LELVGLTLGFGSEIDASEAVGWQLNVPMSTMIVLKIFDLHSMCQGTYSPIKEPRDFI
jgi:hypothetical protein